MGRHEDTLELDCRLHCTQQSTQQSSRYQSGDCPISSLRIAVICLSDITQQASPAQLRLHPGFRVERVRSGVYRVADEGARLLAEPPSRLDIRDLRRFPAFLEWKKEPDEVPDEPSGTPEEALEVADRELTEALEAEVLDRLRKATPSFLEQAVVGLLIAMGYGGGDAAMGRVTGQTGDGGIDGTIKEDKLGLDEVYVQAKKYASGSTVGAGELRNFVGALVGAHAQKGVFVTTADFTASAKKFAAQSPKRMCLSTAKSSPASWYGTMSMCVCETRTGPRSGSRELTRISSTRGEPANPRRSELCRDCHLPIRLAVSENMIP